MKKMLCILLFLPFTLSLIGCDFLQNRIEINKDTQDMTTSENHDRTESEATEATEATGFETSELNVFPGNYAFSLKEVGTISDPEHNISPTNGPHLKGENGDILLSYLGENKIGQEYEDIDYLGSGCYAVRIGYDEINSVGLVSLDGELLIPCNAALIDWPKSTYSDTDRFLKVIDTTGVTTDRDKCIVYSTDTIKIGIGENDTMYAGYARVYDVKQRQFVNGITITNPNAYSLMPCGDHFFVKDEAGLKTLYDANGNSLFQTEQSISVGNGVFSMTENGKYIVYDETATDIYTTENRVEIIHSESGYFLEYVDRSEVVVRDKQCNVLFTTEKTVMSEKNGIFKVRNDDSLYGLLRADGTEITSCKWKSIYEICYGYYYAYESDLNDKTLIGPNGAVAEHLDSCYKLFVEKHDMLLVLNSGEFSVPSGDWLSLRDGLAYGRGGDADLYGLIDLFTGELLLPYEYKNISYAAGYIYAYKDDMWIVFELNGPMA